MSFPCTTGGDDHLSRYFIRFRFRAYGDECKLSVFLSTTDTMFFFEIFYIFICFPCVRRQFFDTRNLGTPPDRKSATGIHHPPN